jgi:general secretion pathway protein K
MRECERGYVLVAALWLLVALSAVALEFSLRTHQRSLVAANLLEAGRARAAADAGIEMTYAKLALDLENSNRGGTSRASPADPWTGLEAASPDSQRIGDAQSVVVLRDIGASVNLNLASEQQLRALLAALRVDYGQADRLAQAIADWRDADDSHRPRGAERDDYLYRGSLALPTNAPFGAVEELHQVLGMTDEIYATCAPYLTTIGSGKINLNSAPGPVLLALPGVSERIVAVLLRARMSGRGFASLEEVAAELPDGPREALLENAPQLLPLVTFETRELLATAEGAVPGSPVRVRTRAVFARAGSSVFLVWKQTQS